MFQVIVRIEEMMVRRAKKNRPFNWISSSGDDIDEILINKLLKYAARDFNFNVLELKKLETFIQEAHASGQKITYFGFEENESIVIEIRDQNDIEGQKAAINKLLFPNNN